MVTFAHAELNACTQSTLSTAQAETHVLGGSPWSSGSSYEENLLSMCDIRLPANGRPRNVAVFAINKGLDQTFRTHRVTLSDPKPVLARSQLVATLDRILDQGPAVFTATQLRLFLRLVVYIDPYSFLEEVASHSPETRKITNRPSRRSYWLRMATPQTKS